MDKEKKGLKSWMSGAFWAEATNDERVLNTTGTKLIYIAVNFILLIGWFISHFSIVGLGVMACMAVVIYIVCFKKTHERELALSYVPLLIFGDIAVVLGTLYQDLGKIDWTQLSAYIKSAFPEGSHTHPSAYLVLIIAAIFFIVAGNSKYGGDKKKYISIGITILGLFILMLQWSRGDGPIPSFRTGGGMYCFIYILFSFVWIVSLQLSGYERNSNSPTSLMNMWLTIIIVSALLLFSIIGIKYLEKTLPLFAKDFTSTHSSWPLYIVAVLLVFVGVVIYTIGKKECIIDGLWLAEFGIIALLITQLKAFYFPFGWIIIPLSLLMWKQSNKLHTSEESTSINLAVSIVIQIIILTSIIKEFGVWAWDRVIVLIAFYALLYMSASMVGNVKARFNLWIGMALLGGILAACYVRMNLFNKDTMIIVGGITLLGVVCIAILNWPSNLKITSSLWAKASILILMLVLLLPICKSYTPKVEVDFDTEKGAAIINIEDSSKKYDIKEISGEWIDIKGLFKDKGTNEALKVGENTVEVKGDKLVIEITDSANRTMTVVRWYPKTLFDLISN